MTNKRSNNRSRAPLVVRVARKELLELMRDGRFRWSTLLIAALLIGSTLVGWKAWADERRQRELAQAEARAHFEHQQEKNPHAAAHYGLYLFKPKQPLAFFDTGVDPYTGVSVYLEAHKRNPVSHRPAADATGLQRFGSLTGASVLQFLMPLLLVFLAFPAIAGEREQGTLRQVLSLGVRPTSLVAGKGLALAVVVASVTLPAALFAIGVLALNGSLRLVWPNVLALSVAYGLYLAVFLGIGLTVSCQARAPSVALLSLLALWMANAMIAPRLATDLSRSVFPTPSALEFQAAIEEEIRNGLDGHDPEDQRLKRLESELLERYDVEFVEDLPINFQGVALQAGEEYANRVHDRHYRRLWSVLEAQDALRQLLGLLFPTLAVREISMGLAGTDNAQFRDFSERAEAHRRALVRRLNKDLEVNGADLGFMYQAGPELWSSMPHFHDQPPGIGALLSRYWIAWLSLALWSLGAVSAVASASRSIRVT